MKEIIAIIRPNKMEPTKKALEALGFPCMTAIPVLGRGKQRGLLEEVGIELRPEVQAQSRYRTMKYIPKRLLSVVAPRESVSAVVQAIQHANQTGQIGDGRIFICPVDDAMRVRTDERGEQAIL